jgi:hypothetical protein
VPVRALRLERLMPHLVTEVQTWAICVRLSYALGEPQNPCSTLHLQRAILTVRYSRELVLVSKRRSFDFAAQREGDKRFHKALHRPIPLEQTFFLRSRHA